MPWARAPVAVGRAVEVHPAGHGRRAPTPRAPRSRATSCRVTRSRTSSGKSCGEPGRRRPRPRRPLRAALAHQRARASGRRASAARGGRRAAGRAPPARAWPSAARSTPASGSSSTNARSSPRRSGTAARPSSGVRRSTGTPSARSARSLSASQPSAVRANHATPHSTSSRAGRSSSRHSSRARQRGARVELVGAVRVADQPRLAARLGACVARARTVHQRYLPALAAPAGRRARRRTRPPRPRCAGHGARLLDHRDGVAGGDRAALGDARAPRPCRRLGAVISFSIFIASMTQISAPSSTVVALLHRHLQHGALERGHELAGRPAAAAAAALAALGRLARRPAPAPLPPRPAAPITLTSNLRPDTSTA